jgi:proteasome lid subunit RPN8/RPN11
MLTSKGPERGGVILSDKSLVELENVCATPNEGYVPKVVVETLDILEDSIGTWHTHPGQTANLSTEDWEAFVEWPTHFHAIVGTDGVRFYRVENGTVLNA